MKPSERRALMAQREAEKLKAEQSAELDENSSQPEKAPKKQREEDQAKPRKIKTEGFFSNHARLIAFIVTSILIVTLFSPFAIDMFLEGQKDKNTVSDKKDMTVQHVYAIADNYGSITWKSFEQFNYTDMSRDDGKYYTREYPIADTLLVLQVGGKTLSGQPEYIYLISLTDAEYINVAKDSVKLFVNKYQDEEK